MESDIDELEGRLVARDLEMVRDPLDRPLRCHNPPSHVEAKLYQSPEPPESPLLRGNQSPAETHHSLASDAIRTIAYAEHMWRGVWFNAGRHSEPSNLKSILSAPSGWVGRRSTATAGADGAESRQT